MLLLASTSDLLRVVTSTAATVDVHASWADNNGGTVTLGRTNTLISTATTTTVVASPGASTYRTVKALTIRNRSAVTVSVTVIHSDGTNVPEMYKARLHPGMTAIYDEHCGFGVLAPSGHAEVKGASVEVNPAVGVLYTSALLEDVANASVTANTMFVVPDLTFTIDGTGSAKTYWFRYVLAFTSAATTTGMRCAISGLTAGSTARYRSEYSLSTTSTTKNEGITAYDTPAASNATVAATTANIATIEGFITTVSGNQACDVFARFASEITASAVTVKAGSRLQWVRTV